MTKKFPNGCIRCHFRLITNRLSGLCDDCQSIKNGERRHRSKIIPCGFCNRKFADYHASRRHEADIHGVLKP